MSDRTYLINQSAHWSGGCAYREGPELSPDGPSREQCHCGNCGAYRNFLAGLTKAYAMGQARELEQRIACEVNGHDYVESEVHENCHVQVLTCRSCADVSVGWHLADRPPVVVENSR